MASVAETLNNAIYSLATLNPSQRTAQALNDGWQAWFGAYRSIPVPTPAFWPQLKAFWLAYAGARALATNLNERTPRAEDIDPTIWKTMVDTEERHVDLLADAGRAAGEAIMSAGKSALAIAAVVAIAVLFVKVRR